MGANGKAETESDHDEAHAGVGGAEASPNEAKAHVGEGEGPAESTTDARTHTPPITEKQEEEEQAAATHHAPKGATWAEPIARFERGWTTVEQRLITFVLLWQLAALVSWVFLNGLSESVTQSAGLVFRAVGAAIVFGCCAWFGLKKLPEERRRNATLIALFVGLAIAPALRKAILASPAGAVAGFDKSVLGYFDNIKGWLQEGSTLTLMGGLRGLATRLTLWIALLGGSLATGAGKHIHVDVVYRFLPAKARIPAAVANYIAAMAVCFAGAWGFFDHIAIESFGSKADDSATVKVAHTVHAIGDHFFFLRKQAGLDLRALPRVLSGTRYDTWMTASQWNTWIDEAGFEGRFKPEAVKGLEVPEDGGNHVPFVISPDGETTRGILKNTLGLVFPFGLLAIGLRFLLRAILTISGHISADPHEAHKEDLKSATRNEGISLEGGV